MHHRKVTFAFHVSFEVIIAAVCLRTHCTCKVCCPVSGTIMSSQIFGISKANVALSALVLAHLLFVMLDLVVARLLLTQTHARSFGKRK